MTFQAHDTFIAQHKSQTNFIHLPGELSHQALAPVQVSSVGVVVEFRGPVNCTSTCSKAQYKQREVSSFLKYRQAKRALQNKEIWISHAKEGQLPSIFFF